jgi:hypothetical protein
MTDAKYNNIYASLMHIQSKISVPKKNENKFGGYKFRNLEDIMEAVKPLLLESQTTLKVSDVIEQVGERYYIKSTATLTYVLDMEQTISVSAYAREAENQKGMNDSQLTGSTSSYARKYALNGLFCIDDTKDSDTTNTGESKPTPELKKTTKQEPKKEDPPVDDGEGKTETGEKLANEKQLKFMFSLAKQKNYTDNMKFYLKSDFDVDNSAELTNSQVSKAIKLLQEMEKVE